MIKRNNKTNRIFSFIYFACILSVSIYAYKKPLYNWDALPYMGVILSYDNHTPEFIHDSVYKIAKQQIPREIYARIADTSMDYKKKMLQNPNNFYNLLPFYVVKPLYTGIGYLLYKSGVPLLKATILPSVVAYVLIGILLFIWLKTYIQIFYAFSISLFSMLSAPMLEVVKTSSPDCMAAFCLLSALYFIIEKKSFLIVFLFLLLSIFARLDNIIPCFFILSLLVFTSKWKEKLSVKKYFTTILILLTTYFLITSAALKYNWDLLYYPSFAKHLNLNYNDNGAFSFNDYFTLFYTHIISSFFFTHFILFILLALIVFIDKPFLKFQKLVFEQELLLIIFLSIIVRFILHPLIADRFFVAYYLVIIVLLIKKYSAFMRIRKC